MSWLSGSWIATAWNNAWGSTSPSAPPVKARGLSHFRSTHFSKSRHFYTAHFAGVGVFITNILDLFKSYVIVHKDNEPVIILTESSEDTYV